LYDAQYRSGVLDNREESVLPLGISSRRLRLHGTSVLLMVFWLVALTSCRSVSIEDIAGTYSVKYAFGNEIMTIKPNGEYTQVITVAGMTPITAVGTWTYDRARGKISLLNHVMAHDGYGGLNAKLKDPHNRWTTALVVKKDLSNDVVIIASADGSGFDYRKESGVK
jgi:hypothetical protein